MPSLWRVVQFAVLSIVFSPAIIALSIRVERPPAVALSISSSSAHPSSSEQSLQTRSTATQLRAFHSRAVAPGWVFEPIITATFVDIQPAAEWLTALYTSVIEVAKENKQPPVDALEWRKGSVVLQVWVMEARDEQNGAISWPVIEQWAGYMLKATESGYPTFFEGKLRSISNKGWAYGVDLNADPRVPLFSSSGSTSGPVRPPAVQRPI